jgi:outer membrane protein, multidrug efflux system
MRAKTPAIFFVIAALGAGCEVGPNYKQPAMNLESHYGELGQTTVSNSPIAAWWETFHDPELNHLVDQALRGNYDLQMAAARIRQSRFQRSMAAADLFPEANAAAGFLHARGSKNVVLPLGGGGGSAASTPAAQPATKRSMTDVDPSGSAANPPLSVLGEGGLPGVTSDVYQAGFDAIWELDVFGGKRRQIEAASAPWPPPRKIGGI